jgi:glutamine synthetase
VIFNGDGYTQVARTRPKKRGMPNLRESRRGVPVLGTKKNADLFKKYKVLSKVETESRAHIFLEKYVKQVQIEAETAIVMARRTIPPERASRSAQQTELAENVAAADRGVADVAGVSRRSSRPRDGRCAPTGSRR